MLNKEARTILDVGCGRGEPMSFINRHRQFYAVGADIFRPYLKKCKQQGIHDEYIQCDVRYLPFSSKSFDLVLCIEVLEHLRKDEGKGLLQELERVAKKQVLLSMPVGKFVQHAHDSNPYQEHKSSWFPSEFRGRGYIIRGSAIRLVGGSEGFLARLPQPLRVLRQVIWVFVSPLTYYSPRLAGWIVCSKSM
jgi:SAM-dependent methyltransferase